MVTIQRLRNSAFQRFEAFCNLSPFGETAAGLTGAPHHVCVFELDDTLFPTFATHPECPGSDPALGTVNVELAAVTVIRMAQRLYGDSNVVIVTAADKK